MILNTAWTQESCLSCKALFAMPNDVVNRYRETHKPFNCPYCQYELYFPAESEKEKYRRLFEEEKQCCISAREEANTLEYKVRAYKGVVTKLRRGK